MACMLFYSDIQLTHEQTSWLTSIAQLGFPLGGLCSGPLMGILGMRLASLFCHLAFYVAGFGLIAFATTVEMLYAGRFLCGMYQVIYTNHRNKGQCLNSLFWPLSGCL